MMAFLHRLAGTLPESRHTSCDGFLYSFDISSFTSFTKFSVDSAWQICKRPVSFLYLVQLQMEPEDVNSGTLLDAKVSQNMHGKLRGKSFKFSWLHGPMK